MTVAELKKFLNKFSDDAKVMVVDEWENARDLDKDMIYLRSNNLVFIEY